MKITCEYCGTLYDDTNEVCPGCGAKNENVRIENSGRPRTIEELKEWYVRMNLPPYETTRFFIGENYKKKRAFGIYKNEKNGVVTVYKNKNDGSRAIRYEGTDEAFAVNELLTRLEEEIVLQKANNQNGKNEVYGTNRAFEKERKMKKRRNTIFLIYAIVFVLIIVCCCGGGIFSESMKPEMGYYSYNDAYYYYYGSEYFKYDAANDDWIKCDKDDKTPSDGGGNKAKNYFISSMYDPFNEESANFTDFKESYYFCTTNNVRIGDGYYKYDGKEYYYLTVSDVRHLFVFEDGEWKEVGANDVPFELSYKTKAEEYKDGWSYKEGSDYTDIENEGWFIDLKHPEGAKKGYYECDSNYYYHYVINENNEYWSVYNEDDNRWDRVSEDKIPEDLWVQSTASDFYYTPDWDSETQFTDFDVQREAEEEAARSSYSSSSYDNDYSSSSSSWDSSDSWDSGSTDWDSDW